ACRSLRTGQHAEKPDRARALSGETVRMDEMRSRNDADLASTSPIGRGRRVAPGEGLRPLVVRHPLPRFALDDASHRRGQIDLSPLGGGEANPWPDRRPPMAK